MRLATHDGRATLLRGSGGIDVERASAGRFGPDPGSLYPRWSEFRTWADALTVHPDEPIEPTLLGPPSPVRSRSSPSG